MIEEQPGEVILVLPRNIAQDELPDELLDLASGGFGSPANGKGMEILCK